VYFAQKNVKYYMNNIGTILYDLSATQPIHGNDFHGGSEYAKAVFYKLCEKLPETIRLEAFYNPNKNIDSTLVAECQNLHVVEHHCKNNTEITVLLAKNNYDVFYSALPYSYIDIQLPANTKFIYTVHGLRDLEYPWDSYIMKYGKQDVKTRVKNGIHTLFPDYWKKHLNRKSVKNWRLLFSRTENQQIIAVSRHTKYAIGYFFPDIDLSAVKTFYSPQKLVNAEIQNEQKTLEALSLQAQKYILLIGGDRSEKGAWRACKALREVLSKNIDNLNDMKIIVLGVSYKKPYLQLINESSQFIFFGYVSASVLETLYKNAHLFMYPTLNEGFGYPPLEAMKYGTLCACSANSAVTEICGDAVLYFNPFDDTEMGIRVLQSFDNGICTEKREKMKQRYKEIREKQDSNLEELIDMILQ
jgi:hypothetical protein